MAWDNPERCEEHFLPQLDKPNVVGKLSILEAEICSFSRMGQKTKKLQLFYMFAGKQKKIRSTDLHDAPLEGSTIFLNRSSLGHTSMESCRLAELKYAIFSRTGRKTKKLRCSKLFLSMVSKHGLLEGSTFLFQYSSIARTPLESSR